MDDNRDPVIPHDAHAARSLFAFALGKWTEQAGGRWASDQELSEW